MTESAATAHKPSTTGPHAGSIDRFVDDFRTRPRRYLTRVIAFGVLIAVGVVGWQIWSDREGKAVGDIARSLQKAGDTQTAGNERVSLLKSIEPQTAGSPSEPFRLYLLALAYRDMADAANTNEEKVESYKQASATAATLIEKFPECTWSKMSSRPPQGAGQPAGPTFAAAVKAYADAQVKWLAAHPFVGAAEPDKNLKITMELDNGSKIVFGKFRSAVAPWHVANFVALAKSGYYEGTGFYAFKKMPKKTATPGQNNQPVVVGVDGGDVMTRLTHDTRDDDGTEDIGYSVRDEQNMLPTVRGSVAALPDGVSGGDSPSRFSIFIDEPSYGAGTVFAEVTEGLDAIEAIAKGDPDVTRADRPKTLVRIKTVTVEGAPDHPIEVKDPVFPPNRREPTPKKPDSQPASSRTSEDSKPASRK